MLETIFSWRGDRLNLDDVDGEERRREALEKGDPAVVQFVNRKVSSALRERVRLIDRYAADLKDELDLDTRVALSADARELLDLSAQGRRAGEIHCMFGARSIFDQAFVLADFEARDPQEAVRCDMALFARLLFAEFFRPGHARLDFITFHDEDAFHAVREVHLRGNTMRHGAIAYQRYETGERLANDLLLERVHPRQVRFTAEGDFVSLYHRPKDDYTSYQKLVKYQHDGRPDPFRLPDRRGFKMVVEDAAAARRVAESLLALLKRHGGQCLTELSDIGTERTGRSVNPDSSNAFRGIQLLINWPAESAYLQTPYPDPNRKGKPHVIEVWIVPAAVHYTSVLATGIEPNQPRSYEAYRLGALLRVVFPHELFPERVYTSISWNSARIRRDLFLARLATFKWPRVHF